MQRLFLYSLYPHCTVYPIAKKHCPFFDFFYERKKDTSILFKPLFVFFCLSFLVHAIIVVKAKLRRYICFLYLFMVLCSIKLHKYALFRWAKLRKIFLET